MKVKKNLGNVTTNSTINANKTVNEISLDLIALK